MRVRAMKSDIPVELDTKSRAVRQLQAAIHRHGFADQLGMEHRYDLFSRGMHHQELRERAVVASDGEVITVDARTVGNRQHAVSIREIGDLDQFRDSAAPSHIRLDDVAATHFQEQSESPASGFMLPRG